VCGDEFGVCVVFDGVFVYVVDYFVFFGEFVDGGVDFFDDVCDVLV